MFHGGVVVACNGRYVGRFFMSPSAGHELVELPQHMVLVAAGREGMRMRLGSLSVLLALLVALHGLRLPGGNEGDAAFEPARFWNGEGRVGRQWRSPSPWGVGRGASDRRRGEAATYPPRYCACGRALVGTHPLTAARPSTGLARGVAPAQELESSRARADRTCPPATRSQ